MIKGILAYGNRTADMLFVFEQKTENDLKIS